MKTVGALLEKKIGPSEFIFEEFYPGIRFLQEPDGVIYGELRLASNPTISERLIFTTQEMVGLDHHAIIALMHAKLNAATERLRSLPHPAAPESPAVAEQSCPPLPE